MSTDLALFQSPGRPNLSLGSALLPPAMLPTPPCRAHDLSDQHNAGDLQSAPVEVSLSRAADPDTSRAAGVEMGKRAGSVRVWLLAYVRDQITATQEDATSAYRAIYPNCGDATVRGRFTELEAAGFLRRCGERENSRGHHVQLWKATDKIGDGSVRAGGR